MLGPGCQNSAVRKTDVSRYNGSLIMGSPLNPSIRCCSDDPRGFRGRSKLGTHDCRQRRTPVPSYDQTYFWSLLDMFSIIGSLLTRCPAMFYRGFPLTCKSWMELIIGFASTLEKLKEKPIENQSSMIFRDLRGPISIILLNISKRVISIQIWFGLTRIRKDFSVCFSLIESQSGQTL